MAIWVSSRAVNIHSWLRNSPSSLSSTAGSVGVIWGRKKRKKLCLVVSNCSSLQQDPETRQEGLQPEPEMEGQEDVRIMCESCNGRGWLLCEFCEGKKTNVKSANNRIYRRCPICRAIGYVLCSKCKVYKCVTFPDYSDGEL